MASEEELREARLSKLNKLKESGINPYPAESNKTHNLNEVINNFDDLESKKQSIIIAGRIMSLRGQGKISFVDLYDGTETFQLVFKIDELGEENLSLFFEKKKFYFSFSPQL